MVTLGARLATWSHNVLQRLRRRHKMLSEPVQKKQQDGTERHDTGRSFIAAELADPCAGVTSGLNWASHSNSAKPKYLDFDDRKDKANAQTRWLLSCRWLAWPCSTEGRSSSNPNETWLSGRSLEGVNPRLVLTFASDMGKSLLVLPFLVEKTSYSCRVQWPFIFCI